MSIFSTSRSDVTLSRPSTDGSFLMRLLSRVEFFLERRRTRLALMELDDEALKDIGISRSDAYREANRPFWD